MSNQKAEHSQGVLTFRLSGRPNGELKLELHPNAAVAGMRLAAAFNP